MGNFTRRVAKPSRGAMVPDTGGGPDWFRGLVGSMTYADYDQQGDQGGASTGDVEGDLRALEATLITAESYAQMLEGSFPQMLKVAGAMAAALSLVKPLLDGLS